MNWVPRLSDIGFGGFAVPAPGVLPNGARSRITFPFGTLASRQVILDATTGNYLLWKFPAASGMIRALANEVVYSVDSVDTVVVSDASGNEVVNASGGSAVLVQMCISNDMETVPRGFNGGVTALDHLGHLDAIVSGTFQVPTAVASARTGHNICDQVISIYT